VGGINDNLRRHDLKSKGKHEESQWLKVYGETGSRGREQTKGQAEKRMRERWGFTCCKKPDMYLFKVCGTFRSSGSEKIARVRRQSEKTGELSKEKEKRHIKRRAPQPESQTKGKLL